jgi:hypothetical protein
LNVLLRLASGFGLGDCISFSVVLKHLAKYRPGWEIDVQGQRGAHAALNGLCRRSFWEDADAGQYDRVMGLSWYDPNVTYACRPSTKPAYFLPVNFGIPYDPELGRYELLVSATAKAAAFLDRPPLNFVALHHEGSSAKPAKDLSPAEAGGVVKAIDAAGCPLLPLGGRLTDPNATDAELLAAVLGRARAFVGIDSGPAKVAAATGIPCLVVWTGHHPAQHFDPMPNVRHLVPHDHVKLLPDGGIVGEGDRIAAARFFEANYDWFSYKRREEIPGKVSDWLGALPR